MAHSREHARRMLEHYENKEANTANELIIGKTEPPAHVAHRAQLRLQGQIKQEPIRIPGGALPNHLSIRDNRFTLVSGEGETFQLPTLYIDCIIVGANPVMSRAYYEDSFDPNAVGFAPPDCWSDNGIAPSTEAGSPQHPTCSGCEKSM